MKDLLCIGRSSMDLFGDDLGADFKDQTGFRAYVGGCPTNICVAAQRLGLRTAMLTGVGKDHTADFILSFLEREGIDTQYSVRVPGYHTNNVMVALQPPDMQFVAIHTRTAADLQITIDDMERVPFDQFRAMLVTGMSLLLDPCRTALQYAAVQAQKHGAKVYLDVDYRPAMWPDPRLFTTLAGALLPHVDVAIGGAHELCAAAGQDGIEAALPVLLDSVREAVVYKRAEYGSEVHTVAGEVYRIPAFVSEVVNFLGAGDAFAGGFIYGHLNGWSYEESARLGNAGGAILVQQHGTANAMPTLAEVRAFMADRKS